MMGLEKTTPLFFYGHDPKRHGENACFSNWFFVNFKDKNGVIFLNTEQYMMYHKAILNNGSPKICKILGRKVKNFNEKIWESERVKIVTNGCLLKFSQNKNILKILLNTNNKLLVEASPYDKIWGIGMSIKKAQKLPQNKWNGLNLLGKCLMDVRHILKK